MHVKKCRGRHLLGGSETRHVELERQHGVRRAERKDRWFPDYEGYRAREIVLDRSAEDRLHLFDVVGDSSELLGPVNLDMIAVPDEGCMICKEDLKAKRSTETSMWPCLPRRLHRALGCQLQ